MHRRADLLRPVSETMQDSKPQRKLTATAAAGLVLYGNQDRPCHRPGIGVVPPGYAAKRMGSAL